MAECTCADPQAVAQAINKHSEKRTQDMADLDETLYGKKLEGPDGEAPGKHGAMGPLRFCNWAAPEWGAKGGSLWTNFFQAAQLAIAVLNALIQGQIADMQQDLADKYYQQAKYKWNRFEKKYMPLEKAILWEASNEPIREMNCNDDRQRAQTAANKSFDYLENYMGQQAKSYRLCLDDSVVSQLSYTRNLITVDTENYNLRDDQWFVDFKNDQRWNRRSNILNLGRNLGSVAMQYGDVARKLMGDVSDIANKAFGGLSSALGYYGSRFDTVYPTTYLAGSMQFGSQSLLSSPRAVSYNTTSTAQGNGVFI